MKPEDKPNKPAELSKSVELVPKESIQIPAPQKSLSVDESFEEKIKLASIQTQLSTKLEYKKAIIAAILSVVAAVTISYFSTQQALKGSRVVGGQYEVKLYEYDSNGQPKRDSNGQPIGRNQAIIPIEFGGVFTKPPRVITSINGVDSWGGANTRVHVYAGANATKDKSDIVVKCWGDSIVYVVQVSWIAFEEVEVPNK